MHSNTDYSRIFTAEKVDVPIIFHISWKQGHTVEKHTAVVINGSEICHNNLINIKIFMSIQDDFDTNVNIHGGNGRGDYITVLISKFAFLALDFEFMPSV